MQELSSSKNIVKKVHVLLDEGVLYSETVGLLEEEVRKRAEIGGLD